MNGTGRFRLPKASRAWLWLFGFWDSRILCFGKLQIPFKPKILPSICCKHVANNKGNINTKKKSKKNARKHRIQHQPTRKRARNISQRAANSNHVTNSSCTMLQTCLPQQETSRRGVHIMDFRFNMLQILWKLQLLTPQCCKSQGKQSQTGKQRKENLLWSQNIAIGFECTAGCEQGNDGKQSLIVQTKSNK